MDGRGGRVVLGLGGCLDYEVAWDAAVLERLAADHGVTVADLGADVEVRTERDLVRSVLGFLRDGVGGERFTASSDVVTAFAARFRSRVRLGGTNVRASLVLDRLGLPSTLHLVSIDDHVRRLLPGTVEHLCSATEDSTDPHLVVQFPAGATVRLPDGEVRAPRPNRLIYVNDVPNEQMRLSPGLGDLLSDAGVFLVSGFNAMRDAATLDRRLGELREHLSRLPDGARVVYEDAGFHVPGFELRVRDALRDRVSLHGLNEDELQGYLGRRVPLLDAEAVAAALHDLRAVLPAPVLVVHTGSWCLALGERAEDHRRALRSGTAVAGSRYVHGDAFDAHHHREALGWLEAGGPHVSRAGREFADRIEALLPGEVACVPALQFDVPAATTVGLGDAFVGGFIAALTRPGPP